MFKKEEIRGAVLIAFIGIMLTARLVDAGTVDPSYLAGFTWINGTNLDVDAVHINGTDYTSNIISGGGAVFDQDLNTTDAVGFVTVNTGQGNIELYGMNQNVTTGDAVGFVTVNTGQGDNELFDMDQNVLEASDVTFNSLVASNWTLAKPEDLSNNQSTGSYIMGQAGEALNFADMCYLATDGDYMKADADAAASMYIVVMAAEKLSNAEVGHFLVVGYIRCDTWSALTVGSAAPIMASVTPGAFSQTAPSGSGDQVQRVGYAIASKIVRFNPDSTIIEIT